MQKYFTRKTVYAYLKGVMGYRASYYDRLGPRKRGNRSRCRRVTHIKYKWTMEHNHVNRASLVEAAKRLGLWVEEEFDPTGRWTFGYVAIRVPQRLHVPKLIREDADWRPMQMIPEDHYAS